MDPPWLNGPPEWMYPDLPENQMETCEWNPVLHRPAGSDPEDTNCQRTATVSVGVITNYHVCAGCAMEDVFAKMKMHTLPSADLRTMLRQVEDATRSATRIELQQWEEKWRMVAKTPTAMALDILRGNKGASITINAQNAEGCGPDNELVEVTDDWTDWEPRGFQGTTLTEALAKAVDAMPARCKSPAPGAPHG